MRVFRFLISLVAIVTAGCISSGHHSKPITPPDASGPTPGHFGYTETYFLDWNGSDLEQLESLRIEGVPVVKVLHRPSPFLRVKLTFDVQKDEYERHIREFLDQVQYPDAVSRERAQSPLIGKAPLIRIPHRNCAGGKGSQPIQGICVREIEVSVPQQKRLALQASWGANLHPGELPKFAANGFQAQAISLELPSEIEVGLTQTSGAFSAQGGGVQAKVGIQGHQGSAKLMLAAANTILLSQIQGAIDVALEDSSNAVVKVDQQDVTLPYHRP